MNKIEHDSKELAISILQSAIQLLEENENLPENPMKGLQGFDCDAMQIVNDACMKVTTL